MIQHHQTCKCKILTVFSLILLFPTLAFTTKCSCEQQEVTQIPSQALKFKLIAIGSILCSGSLGVGIPFLFRNIQMLHPDKEIFFLIKAFAAGVILATGFIHILPDAFDSLTSPCLSTPMRRFPFSGLVAMLSAIGTLMMESFATGYNKRSELMKALPFTDPGDHDESDYHEHGHGDGANGGHIHGSAFVLERTNSADVIRHRIVSQMLEVGIVVHSVIIGLSLGASDSPKTIRPLVAALSFHQFFEGMGLGGCISQAKYRARAIAIMVSFFSLTTPTGIAVGIVISKSYSETTPTALIVQGILNSASAGILIYMALVGLLAHEFMKSKMLVNFRLQLGANFALLLGAGTMSLLAKWGDH